MKASYRKYILQFKRASGTSRGIMTEKESWFLILRDKGRLGLGECGLLRGLSIDDLATYETRLEMLCQEIHQGLIPDIGSLQAYPSIQFGLEQALSSLTAPNPFILFPSDFTRGSASIPINGLIWMGDREFMQAQVREKLEEGYRCIKLKIGALDFETELGIIRSIRNEHPEGEIELRVDANGAFSAGDALEKLKRLSEFGLHSIEQPIRQGQWEAMAHLCANTPLPIALDEELIGLGPVTERQRMLQTIKPHYLVLKPSLLGGYASSGLWIELAEDAGAGWWVTSALESNIGLNAIAQWTWNQAVQLPQGLGTGSLFANNFNSPLTVGGGSLSYDGNKRWTDKIEHELCT